MAIDCQAVADSHSTEGPGKSEKTKSYLCYLGECVVRRHTSTSRDSSLTFLAAANERESYKGEGATR